MPPKRAIKKAKVKSQTFLHPLGVSARGRGREGTVHMRASIQPRNLGVCLAGPALKIYSLPV